MNHSWRCPKCTFPLLPTYKQINSNHIANSTNLMSGSIELWHCDNQHSFDVAKEGYVNLLLANQKKSKQPGDNQEMISARRSFLNEGHFAPLPEKLAELICHHQHLNKADEALKLLDIGCGEGYYLQNLTQLLKAKEKNPQTLGVDISKAAIVKASKRMQSKKNLTHQFAVASNYNLPVNNDSMDICIQVFAPSSEPEVSRVTKHGGLWIKVEPAAKHLHELKTIIYESPEDHSPPSNTYADWEVVKQTDLEFSIELDNIETRNNLLSMTPFKWRLTKEKHLHLQHNLTMVTANFSISVLCKKQ